MRKFLPVNCNVLPFEFDFEDLCWMVALALSLALRNIFEHDHFDRLIEQGKLMDALALSDRFLRNGASDQLLQMLIERGEENLSGHGQSQIYGDHNIWSNSWQYCLRLKDKQLAARLALKYV